MSSVGEEETVIKFMLLGHTNAIQILEVGVNKQFNMKKIREEFLLGVSQPKMIRLHAALAGARVSLERIKRNLAKADKINDLFSLSLCCS